MGETKRTLGCRLQGEFVVVCWRREGWWFFSGRNDEDIGMSLTR